MRHLKRVTSTRGQSPPNQTQVALMDYLLAFIPIAPSLFLITYIFTQSINDRHMAIGVSLGISVAAYFISNSLIPTIASYTQRKGLSGKDLGKKGLPEYETKEIPEALGILTGTLYLIAAIFIQLIILSVSDFDDDTQWYKRQVIYNSALFSVCFMIFLGFADDTLDLKWRYKLVLPTIASLPLLTTYSGSTAIYVPSMFQSLLMTKDTLTPLGQFISLCAIVDLRAHGAIIELGHLFLVFMGFLAVFCTNSINIYAGINGLECGQAYVIAASILFYKLFESSFLGISGNDQEFAIVMTLPFLAVSLSLLRHNWYPAQVFVGDTFCYFAGMTFAVVGIHGHFSKTLLLLFMPQVVNFLMSIPQLFKLMPCPRHRLPRYNAATNRMTYSAFPCLRSEYRLFKVTRDSTECPNMTLICLVLRLTGPLHEKTLCTVLLGIQLVVSVGAFIIRYHLFPNA